MDKFQSPFLKTTDYADYTDGFEAIGVIGVIRCSIREQWITRITRMVLKQSA
jgi:hypothetical protein